MDKQNDITRGILREKMSGYTPEAPEGSWDTISERLRPGRSRKYIYYFLAGAAGIALALGVGLPLLIGDKADNVTENQQIISEGADMTGTVNEKGFQPNQESGQNIAADIDRHVPSDKDIQFAEQPINPEPAISLKREPLRQTVSSEVRNLLTGEKNAALLVADAGIQDENELTIEIGIKLPEKNITPLSQVEEDSLLNLLHGNTEVEIAAGNDKSESMGKWSLGAAVSPKYSYRDAASSNTVSNTLVNESESAKFTYSGGMRISFLPSDKLTIESGVYFSQMGINIGGNSAKNLLYDAGLETSWNATGALSNSIGTLTSSGEQPILSNYGEANAGVDNSVINERLMADNTSFMGLSQTFGYLEIPFLLRYKVFDRDFGIELTGGMSTNFLLSSGIKLNTSSGNENLGAVNDIKNLNYSGNAGVGFIYDFTENFSLSLEPRFQYFLNSVNAANLPSTRPYSFGLFSGLNYSF